MHQVGAHRRRCAHWRGGGGAASEIRGGGAAAAVGGHGGGAGCPLGAAPRGGRAAMAQTSGARNAARAGAAAGAPRRAAHGLGRAAAAAGGGRARVPRRRGSRRRRMQRAVPHTITASKTRERNFDGHSCPAVAPGCAPLCPLVPRRGRVGWRLCWDERPCRVFFLVSPSVARRLGRPRGRCCMALPARRHPSARRRRRHPHPHSRRPRRRRDGSAAPTRAARGRRAAGPSGSSCHNGAVVTAVVEQEKEVAGGLGARPGSLAAAGTLAGTHRVGCLGVGRGVGCVLAASAGRTPRVPCRRDAGLVGVRVCWPLRPSLLAPVLCPDPWGRAPGAVPFRARSGRSARAGRPLDGGCEPCRVRHRQRGGGSGRRRRPSDARSRQVARRSRCHPVFAATGWPAARRAARVGRDAHKRRVVTAVAPVPYRWCSSHLVQTLALRVYRPDDGGGGTCRGQQSPVCAASPPVPPYPYPSTPSPIQVVLYRQL